MKDQFGKKKKLELLQFNLNGAANHLETEEITTEVVEQVTINAPGNSSACAISRDLGIPYSTV